MLLKFTDFGHLGLFAKQHANWQRLKEIAKPKPGESMRVLNLFAYTGGSTLACAHAGAEVVHLDASKTTVTWARENAEASGLGGCPVRWIVDDVKKFVEREQRRGSTYHGIILDPPSYGRGPKGQIWKIEDDLTDLLTVLVSLLDPDFKFFLLSAHSQGYTPVALKNMIGPLLPTGNFDAHEMIIDGAVPLPSGASCLYERTLP
jgi:23S rRNA (cytosine1962-C5)-methyltransferase